jgi:hypothetical protein
MGVIVFFKSPERCVYLVCVVLGLIAYIMFRPAVWAPYVGLMVTYHLFLFYILFGSVHEFRRSFGIPATIASHLLCVVVLLALSKILMAYTSLQFLRTLPLLTSVLFMMWAWKAIAVLQYLIAYALATHERDFLFAGEVHKRALENAPPKAFAASAATTSGGAPLTPATGEDHRDWLLDRERRKAAFHAFYKPGTSVQNDFEQWLRARGKTHYTPAPTDASSATIYVGF